MFLRLSFVGVLHKTVTVIRWQPVDQYFLYLILNFLSTDDSVSFRDILMFYAAFGGKV